jgi:MFS family permease
MVKKSWTRIAFAMFAVGWGANQFSSMLIVYRHERGLSAAAVAGLFAIYAGTLVPGLLTGGPASDRFGRRAVVLPFVVVSPIATVLLMLGAHVMPLVITGRALAGLCSGVVFGASSAWVRDTSQGSGQSARRAALALTAGFGLGPVVAAALAQWAPDPLVVPYIPHLVLGAVSIIMLWPVAGPAAAWTGQPRARGSALRTPRFWLVIAPVAPLVFGSVSLAIVVLPEEVTSARALSAGYAGLMTALAFCAGVAVQPVARRLESRLPGTGSLAGLCCAASGAGLAIPAVASGGDTAKILAGGAAVLFGASYGMILVSGLQQAEALAGPAERGAVLGAYYVLAYLGFGAPYLAAELIAAVGKPHTFVILAIVATALAVWTAGHTLARERSSERPTEIMVLALQRPRRRSSAAGPS